MTVLTDIANAMDRYPTDETTIEIIDVAKEGNANDTDINELEVWKFKVRVTNTGHLDMTGVSLFVRTSTWITTTEKGERFDLAVLVMATGCLSIPQAPNFHGLETFKGEWYHSADWPTEGVNFAGKRVGIIGTGLQRRADGRRDCREGKHLTVFQRTANFSVPAQNEPLDREVL